MSREPILGHVDRDHACAVALGLVEDARVVVILEALTVHDAQMRTLGTVRDWLLGNDPLDAATREYLSAGREVSQASGVRLRQSPWQTAASIKARDPANRRAREARDLGRALLAERGFLAHARRAGLNWPRT
jgi:hypothetical protein